MAKSKFLFLLIAATLIFSATAKAADGEAQASGELFKEFGEKAGLTKTTNDFVALLLVDPRTEHFFAKTDLVRLKEKLYEQFCEALEGPCKYTGRKMGEVHDGLEIKASDFNALVEDLQKAMQKNHVPMRAQNKLLAKLAPMHKDVIEK
jgi:hemoglobin